MNNQSPILAETPWYMWLALGAAGMYVVYSMMNNDNESYEEE